MLRLTGSQGCGCQSRSRCSRHEIGNEAADPRTRPRGARRNCGVRVKSTGEYGELGEKRRRTAMGRSWLGHWRGSRRTRSWRGRPAAARPACRERISEPECAQQRHSRSFRRNVGDGRIARSNRPARREPRGRSTGRNVVVEPAAIPGENVGENQPDASKAPNAQPG